MNPGPSRILIAAVVLTLALGASIWAFNRTSAPAQPDAAFVPATATPVPAATPNPVTQALSDGTCTGSGVVTLTSLPLAAERIQAILPMGATSADQLLPADYLSVIATSGTRPAVSSLAAGTVVSIARTGGSAQTYRVAVEHSCQFYSVYDQIGQLSADLSAAYQAGNGAEPVLVRQPVQSGTTLGWLANAPLRLGVVDATIRPSLIKPEAYAARAWYPYGADPFGYFSDALRGTLEAKAVKADAPLGGRFSYDLAGTAAGNWFKRFGGGYAAPEDSLSIAYDAVDPSQIVISIGNWRGRQAQLAVIGNAPDPASLSRATGVAKYEVIGYDYKPFDPETGYVPGTRLSLAPSTTVQGTMLVQVQPDTTLLVETFPGKRAREVSGFTSAAATYER